MLARLTAAAQRLDEATARTAAAAQDVEEARSLVAGALEGVAASQLVGVLEAYRDALMRATQGGEPAKNQVRETMARVQALGT
jgi:hypothetical protein